MATRQELATEVDKWIGTRWRHQGRTLVHGVDCIGLLLVSCWALGIGRGYSDPKNYSRTASKESLLDPFRGYMVEKKRTDFDLGDVVLLKDDIFPCHVGIISQMHPHVKFTHAYAKLRKVVKQDMDAHWQSRITHCFEFKEFA